MNKLSRTELPFILHSALKLFRNKVMNVNSNKKRPNSAGPKQLPQ